MLLKNLMEDKQLDFNQPLLSVRRYSSGAPSSEGEGNRKSDNSLPKIPPLPVYKSELKSGPVSNPGTVPFLWEQIPGRPKEEGKSQTPGLERPPIAPKLPPGRILNVKQQAFDKYSEGTAVNPSQTGNVLSNTQNISSLDQNVAKNESSKDGMEEEKGSSSSEDGDETYLDALDTLSRTESFFLNCSESGLSGFDGSEVKPSGVFSTDPQTQEFMMGRFLPAAKAMASETPQFAPRKQPMVREQPRQIKKVVTGHNQHPLNRYRPEVLPHYAQNRYGAESDDEGYYDESVKSSASICGLFPRFCLKNSFGMLSPVPGMRMQARVPNSSVHRMQAKSSVGSRSKTESEHARDAVCEKRSMKGPQTTDMKADKIELKSNFNQNTNKSDYQKLDGSSLYRRLQGNGQKLSLPHVEKGFRGVLSDKAKNSQVNGFNPHRKGYKSFRELLADDSSEGESSSAIPVAEKTLYIDAVHLVKSTNSSSSSSDMKGLPDYRGDDLETLLKGKEMEESPSVDSSVIDIKKLNFVDEKAISGSKTLESVNSCFLSPPHKSCHDVQTDMIKVSNQDQNLIQDSKTLTSSKVAEDQMLYLENQWLTKSGHQENSHGRYSQQLPLTPPLPKSPSESWLSRTLPAMSSKNPSSLPSLGRIQASKTSSIDPKWETIVKISNPHHGHLRFSEELLTPIPEA